MKTQSIPAVFVAGCLFSLVACTDSPTQPDVRPVVLSSSVVDAGGSIFRTLDVGLDMAGPVQVEYWAEGAPRLLVTDPDTLASHSVFLPRLRGETSYEYEVRPLYAGGRAGPPLTGQFQTDTLPTKFAAYQFHVVGDATFPVLLLDGNSVMIDTDGYVVWYRPGEHTSGGFTRRANGDFVFLSGVGLVRGGTVTQQGTTWVGDEIWEWDPDTDDLALRWAASDFLSPGVDRGARSVPSDWLHANSISLGPRGNVVVSLFRLHEVLSVASDYQSIEWRLGGPASSFVVADGAMDAGQHTAAEVSPNRVLLFDNGQDRPSGERFSRASEIELDPTASTARIVWQFRPQPDNFAPAISSARRLENGSIVVGFGFSGPGVLPATGPLAAFEVTTDGRVLWQITVQAGANAAYRLDPLTDIAGEVDVPWYS